MSNQNYDTVMPRPNVHADLGYPRGQPVAPVRERPSAWSVNLLIAAFVLPVSLIPATYGTVLRLPLMPYAWWSVNLIIVFALVVLLFRGLGGFSYRVSRSTKRWFLLPILVLGMWQVVSLAWNGRDNLMRTYSFLQTLCMCAAVLSGVLLSSGLSYAARLRVARGTTLLIAFVIAVYTGLSFVFPRWRPSSAWMDWTTYSLGFIRVFGPLGKPTLLNFILLPVLGLSIGMIFVPGRLKLFWGLLALFFLFATLSTGSRGGVLSLVVFGVLLMLSLRLRSLTLLLPAAVVLGGLLLFTGVPERFRNIEDRARVETYATALRTFAASPKNVLVGAGHGALYSKLHDDTLRKMHGKGRWYLLKARTAFGYTLRNSHSALMRTLVETGVTGFLLFLTPLIWILRRLLARRFHDIRSPGNMWATCVLAGCAAVIPYMVLDEFFVGAFWVVFLWTTFVVEGAETAAETSQLGGI